MENTIDNSKEKVIETKVVGIRFKEVGKIYYFDPDDLDIKSGDQVIVETVRGMEFGEVVVSPRWIPEKEVSQPLRKIIRKATREDKAQLVQNQNDEREAMAVCTEKIEEHRLDMKLVDVEYTFDRSKVIFYFTAEGRVDFRNLVKDLASVFRTRIELRQIGVRDEAKMIGGLGSCGRELCCSTFLGDFETVSIKMAKEQNLSLNPNKISGICGRLMCCLKYENDTYCALRKKMPRQGARVKTMFGVAAIDTVNLLQETVLVKYADGKRETFSAKDVEVVDKTTPLDAMEQAAKDNYARLKSASDDSSKTQGTREKAKPPRRNEKSDAPDQAKDEDDKKKSRNRRRRKRKKPENADKKEIKQDQNQSQKKKAQREEKPRKNPQESKNQEKNAQEGAAKKKRRRSNRNRKRPEGTGKEGAPKAPKNSNENH